MRYFLRCGNQVETIARREYLEQTFHLWFIEKGTIDSFSPVLSSVINFGNFSIVFSSLIRIYVLVCIYILYRYF